MDDQRQVDALAPHYIWTTDYAQSRLRWKPMLPLSALLLRVFRLSAPVTAPWQPEYGGCTSWVEVLSDIPLGRLEPALSDAEFRARAEAVRGSLGLVAGGVKAMTISAAATISEICAGLRGMGEGALADRLDYLASEEDLDTGECPATAESARGFFALFAAVESESKVGAGLFAGGLGGGGMAAFPDDQRCVGIWFLDG